jgi:hypothetical protein
LETLHQTYEVKEQPFRSDVPVFGRAIVALRNLWNSVSTRWYVLPILQQQNEFNAAAASSLNDLYAELDTLAFYWDSDSTILHLVEREIELERRIVALEGAIQQLGSSQEGEGYG